MKIYNITRTNPNGSEENIYTAIKVDADNFLMKCIFMPEVEFTYKKFDMDEKGFHRELVVRLKEENKNQMSLL